MKKKVKNKKQLAQNLIMEQIAKIGYGSDYEEFLSKFDSEEEAQKVLYEQMNRVAKMFGFESAWFY